MSLILGIESTCDETAASVVRDATEVLSNVIATQYELHEKYRGVVPEIASRAHIENILPVVREALLHARCDFADLDAISVAHRPGLVGSLLIGVTAAKTLAWALGKPLVGVDHVHAHLYSVMLKDSSQLAVGSEHCPLPTADHSPPFPAVGLVCSGGHTALYSLRSWTDVTLIGSTIDDAVGEAYDKVSAILGLGYPGGPVIDRLSREGDASVVRFPRPLLGRDSLDFSFSGLKTAVLYHVRGVAGKPPKPVPTTQDIADTCAAFQEACIDVLLRKIRRAVAVVGARSVIVGGGVSANQGLRTAMQAFELPVFFPHRAYCTDNAAMSAGLGGLLFQNGTRSPLDLDAITHSQFLDV